MGVYIYMYTHNIYMYTHTQYNVCLYIYIYMCVSIYIYMYVYIYTHMYLYIHIYIYIYTHIFNTHVFIYISVCPHGCYWRKARYERFKVKSELHRMVLNRPSASSPSCPVNWLLLYSLNQRENFELVWGFLVWPL